MANTRNAKKAARQAVKRRLHNRYYAKTTRNAIRAFRAMTENKAAGEALPKVISMIDKLAKRNIIHDNKASNLKSKLMKRLNSLAK
jgi:small subunit ribosomal protein S20